MLYCFFTSNFFLRFCQSGCYIDFFTKKWSEVFVRNIYIYASQYLGEKFIIEELTKRIFFRFFWQSSKFFYLSKLSYSFFFIQIISFLFYSLTILLILVV